MENIKLREGSFGLFDMFCGDEVVWINVVAAEEPGQNNVAPECLARAPCHQVVRNDAKKRTQFKNIPGFFTENLDGGAGPRDGIQFARNGLNQRRFAATVRAQNGNVLSASDAQIEIVQDGAIAAHDFDVAEL